MKCKVLTMDTWLSPITIVETEKGVRYVDFDDGARQFVREVEGQLTRVSGTPRSAEEFTAYLEGQLQNFSAPVDLIGTPFQVQCWLAMRRIDYGTVITYADQGHLVGTRGYRAVGQANRRNPAPLIIPCHRVVAANGPGGYFGGGLELKRSILEFEGFHWPAKWATNG